ncbi:MAG: LysR family transcriptional regulator [Ruminococcaceae bacterium]|nr:LysR family transcriptional regulator [Oscillospiraceae bacterium]
MQRKETIAKLHPKLTLQFFTDEKCFGPGVALLLEKIKENNSIRKAAFSIGMSYSKAWTIIKRAEENLGFELLISKTGGADGGGAVLTQKAERLLSSFRLCEAELFEYGKNKYIEHFSWIEENSKLEK